MTAILKIKEFGAAESTAVDFTDYILLNKFKWARNDVDDEKSGRTQDLIMHRKRKGQKRKLGFTCRRLSTAEVRKLAGALNPVFIDVQYLDPELGVVWKTFYGTSITACTAVNLGGDTKWDETSFELVER